MIFWLVFGIDLGFKVNLVVKEGFNLNVNYLSIGYSDRLNECG